MMRMLPSCLLISLLVVEVEAKSLNEAMAKIKKEAGFDPKEPPEHKTDIKVGLYLEHLLDVSALRTLRIRPHTHTLLHARRIPPRPSACTLHSLRLQVSISAHTFDMDFYLTEEWKDGRNYSALFSDENLVELEPDSCEEQRTARSARNLLAMKPSARDIDGQERRVRRLAEAEIVADGDFNPGKGDVVKYFNEHAGDKGTTYTATIKSLSTNAEGKVTYNIEYKDESTQMVSRPTFLETLSSMPQPARRFVEFGHDELKLIWEPDVHITNLHQDMITHEEVPLPRTATYLYSLPYPLLTPTALLCAAAPRVRGRARRVHPFRVGQVRHAREAGHRQESAVRRPRSATAPHGHPSFTPGQAKPHLMSRYPHGSRLE